MDGSLAKVSAPIFIFLLGYLLKRGKILQRENGELFLKLIFYIVLPALYLVSIPSIKLVPSLFLLPLEVPFVIFLTFCLSFVIGKLLKLKPASFGVFLISTMIMNTGVVLPFLLVSYGNPGLVRLSLLDGANALFTFSFIYFIACKHGDGEKNTKLIVQKVLLAPPIWATIVGLVLNLLGVTLPFIITNFLQTIGNLATPLIMLALGTYFTFSMDRINHVFPGIIVRYGFGLILGFLFASIFHLEGLTRIVAIICAGAPIGYNTLTFSSLEHLDIDYAASIVSISMLLGVFIVPFLLLVIK